MANEQANQLNLTVVALVALVAIVGLVALVLNTQSIAKIATGNTLVSAQDEPSPDAVTDGSDTNLAGDIRARPCLSCKK